MAPSVQSCHGRLRSPQLQAHQLDATTDKVNEIGAAVYAQLVAISEDGMIDVDQAAVDFACLQ